MRLGDFDALIIVDVQNDFCPGGKLAVPHGHDVIPVINLITPSFETVVATQDWHPAGHISFASVGGTWPDHCIQGTRGAKLHPDLTTGPVQFILRKGFRPGMDSYSAFYENDHRTATGLHALLHGLNIRRVFIAGLATDYCVFFTAMDALRCGLRPTVVQDACRGVGLPEGSIAAAISEMTKAGVEFVDSSDICS